MFNIKRRELFSLLFLYLFTNFSYAQTAPTNILLQKCYFNYNNIYKHLKGHKAFAYVRVTLGEEDYCAWSHNASSEENAKRSALHACKQQKVDSLCKIIDVNNVWLNNEGAFSSIMPADNTPLSQQEYTSLTNQAKTMVLGECLSLFNTHLQDKGHKVFAYSVDEDGHYACGSSKEHQTLRTAAIIALKICEDKRSSMGNKAPKSTCLSYSDGRKILVNENNFELTLHKKINKYLSQDEYTHYVKEGVKYLSGFCLTQYKYYLRDKDHKAFYIAQDIHGKIACGRSVNGFTVTSAKKHALSLCEISAKKEQVQSKCELFMLNDELR